MMKPFFILLCLPFALLAQPKAYQNKRELLGINAQWHKIVLPNDVFGKVKPDFSDLRIYGITAKNDTVEAPYLLQVKEPKIIDKNIDFKLLNQTNNEKGHYFTFEMPVETTINEINLAFEQDNFDWKIKVEGSQNQQEWFNVIDDYRILSIKNDQTNFTFTKVSMPDTKFRYCRILIKDKGTCKLSSAKITKNEAYTIVLNDYNLKNTSITEDSKAKKTIVFLDLAAVQRICKLKINLASAFDYYRPITIEYLSDSTKTQKGWLYNYNTLASGTLNSLDKKEFMFASTTVQKLRITIDNEDNKPLALSTFSVSGYGYELVARFLDPAVYSLYYGNPNALMPQYDIAAFTAQIPKDVSTLQYGEPQNIATSTTVADAQPIFKNKFWLWGVMAIVIGLLGWFSLKMIQTEDEN